MRWEVRARGFRRSISARSGRRQPRAAGRPGSPADLRHRDLYEGALPLSISSPPPRRHSIRRHRRHPVTVAENLANVRERIARTGRNPDEITIVAVTKGFDVAVCRDAVAAGLNILGENRVHEALTKMEEVPDPEWHLIGHLQTNKARVAPGRFALLHSVDPIHLPQPPRKIPP